MHTVLVDHVPAPVVLARERLAAGDRVGAALFGAVVLAALAVLVVDVTVQMRPRAEALAAARNCALVWPLVVTFVVAGMLVGRYLTGVREGEGNLLELVNLVKDTAAIVASKGSGRSGYWQG